MFTKLRFNLARWIMPGNANEVSRDMSGSAIGYSKVREVEDYQSSHASFKIQKARGGYVITVARYDHSADNQQCSTYVVMDSADLGEEIAKILTLEAMYMT